MSNDADEKHDSFVRNIPLTLVIIYRWVAYTMNMGVNLPNATSSPNQAEESKKT